MESRFGYFSDFNVFFAPSCTRYYNHLVIEADEYFVCV
ncbi:hypothetical protein EZS27_017938 [termite gut metagenome]|uniref:Uncharacterized protein n=1 Tax=termite gut metagenome TaxID=433724 RepID=A0A5J4RLK9_9ZZZZ